MDLKILPAGPLDTVGATIGLVCILTILFFISVCIVRAIIISCIYRRAQYFLNKFYLYSYRQERLSPRATISGFSLTSRVYELCRNNINLLQEKDCAIFSIAFASKTSLCSSTALKTFTSSVFCVG